MDMGFSAIGQGTYLAATGAASVRNVPAAGGFSAVAEDGARQAQSTQSSQAAGQDPAIAEQRAMAKVKMDEFTSECQTCKNRKYQDGSNDPGVSFKAAAHIDPESSASVVIGHEMEHVSHEQAKAEQNGAKVVQQYVILHNSVCPECGRPYVAGGETTTVTSTPTNQQNMAQQFEVGKAAGGGKALDAAV